MKKIFSLLLAASAFACTQEKVVEITISNPSTTDRTNEITEITSDAITKLKGETFIISDNTGFLFSCFLMAEAIFLSLQ